MIMVDKNIILIRVDGVCTTKLMKQNSIIFIKIFQINDFGAYLQTTTKYNNYYYYKRLTIVLV